MTQLPITLTPELLALVAGSVLSLLFSYIPGLRTKFAALCGETKRLIMAGLLMIVTIGIFALVHFGALTPSEPLSIWGYIYLFIQALIANQGTYTLSPPPIDVVKARETRPEAVCDGSEQ